MATALRRFLVVIPILISFHVRAANEPRTAVDAVAVQEAIRQGRELLMKGDAAKAIEVLEKHLGRTKADPQFLATLKEAYQTYLKELHLGNKFETYELYRRRLAVLDKMALPAVAPKKEIVRGARPDDDPFQQTPLNEQQRTANSLELAQKAFAERKYSEARVAFERARADGVVFAPAQNSQHAYCLLNDVVTRLNAGSTPPADIERDVRAALALAPNDAKLGTFGQDVLQKNRERPSTAPNTPVAIRHSDAGQDWKRAESANFRLTHTQEQAYAEQVLRLAEQHRSAALSKWGAPASSNWQPICDIYLHANGANYAKATSQPATSPGHSSLKSPNGKVTLRRIDLRVDNAEMTTVTLPHEITHVVLGDLFAGLDLPRWADEGMAVLSEPRSQVDRYLKTMVRLRKEAKLIPLAKIVTKAEYPDAAAITIFYVESVSVVEFLVNQKGPAAFVQFVRDSTGGFEAALLKHYGWKDIAMLQDRWLRATFTEIDRVDAAGQ